VIHIAPSDDGDSLEAPMGMLGKPGDDITVIHAPAVEIGEVGSDPATGEAST
jgi:hypothetical protein